MNCVDWEEGTVHLETLAVFTFHIKLLFERSGEISVFFFFTTLALSCLIKDFLFNLVRDSHPWPTTMCSLCFA